MLDHKVEVSQYIIVNVARCLSLDILTTESYTYLLYVAIIPAQILNAVTVVVITNVTVATG